MNVLAAHPRGFDDEALDAVTCSLGRLAAPGDRLVLGRDDYKAMVAQCDGWENWIASVAQRYDGLIVVANGDRIGAATARMVELARRYGKPVVLAVWTDGHGAPVLHPVRGVEKIGQRDYQRGWRVLTW